MRRAVRPSLPATLAALALAGLAGCGEDTAGGPSDVTPAGEVVRVDGRVTALTLDLQTLGVLEDNGVGVGVARPATARSGTARFPITGGSVSATTIQGPITHGGAIVFSRGERRAELTRLVLDTRTGLLTAVVGETRRAMARVVGARTPTRPADSSRLTLNGLPLLLTPTGAEVLNEALDTSAFQALLPLGEATVRITVA